MNVSQELSEIEYMHINRNFAYDQIDIAPIQVNALGGIADGAAVQLKAADGWCGHGMFLLGW